MVVSLLVIFDEIWPKAMYYSTGSLAQFFSNFKNFTVKILSTMSKGNPDVHVYSHS